MSQRLLKFCRKRIGLYETTLTHVLVIKDVWQYSPRYSLTLLEMFTNLILDYSESK